MTNLLNLLLVDDSAADALITGKLLERNKPEGTTLSVTNCSRISEARTALQAGHYDCALLDLHLPDGRGQDNVSALLEISPGLPIVVLSGSEGPHMEEEVLKHGARAFVMKQPLSQSDDIFSVITDAIEHSAAQTR